MLNEFMFLEDVAPQPIPSDFLQTGVAPSDPQPDAWDHWADLGAVDSWDPALYIEQPLRPNGVSIIPQPLDETDHWSDPGVVDFALESMLDHVLRDDVIAPDTSSIQDIWDHWIAEFGEHHDPFVDPPLVADVLAPDTTPTFDPWGHWEDALWDEFSASDPVGQNATLAQDFTFQDIPLAFDDEFVMVQVPDIYAQANGAVIEEPGPHDPWPYFEEFTDTAPLPATYSQQDVAVVGSSAQLPDSLLWEDIDISTLPIPGTFLQANNTPPNTAQLPDLGPVFDGTDEDLDELVILDFANFRIQEVAESYVWDWNADFIEDWRPDDGTALDSTPADVVPYVGSIAFVGYAPNVSNNNSYIPGAGTLAFVGYAPLIENRVIIPSVSTLAFVGYPPNVSTVAAGIVPATGGMTFVGYAPSIRQTPLLSPDTGAITFLGYPPFVGQAQTIQMQVGAMAFVGYAPEVTNQDVNISPPTGSLVILGYAPSITQPNAIPAIDTGVLSFVGFAPSVRQSPDIFPEVGSFTFTGFAPTLQQLTTPINRHLDIDDGDRIIDIL